MTPGRRRPPRANASGGAWATVLVVVLAMGAAAGGGYLFLTRGKAAPQRMGGAPGEVASSAAPGGEKAVMRLFFASADGTMLEAEERTVPAPDGGLAACRTVIAELQRGPREGGARLLPPDLEVRGLYLSEPVLVVDLAPGIGGSATGVLRELLLWQSIVAGVTMNVPGVTAVSFLVEGREQESILGHIDTRGPLTFRPDLVRGAAKEGGTAPPEGAPASEPAATGERT